MSGQNCLHCKIVDLIEAHFRELQELPAGATPEVRGHDVIEAIGHVMGSVQAHAETPVMRMAMFAHFVRAAEGYRRAIAEIESAKDGGRAGAPLQ